MTARCRRLGKDLEGYLLARLQLLQGSEQRLPGNNLRGTTSNPDRLKVIAKLGNQFNLFSRFAATIENLHLVNHLFANHLRTLWIVDNQLTNVKGLENLTKLTYLDLKDNPDLTKAQIDELQKALPNCKIEHDAK